MTENRKYRWTAAPALPVPKWGGPAQFMGDPEPSKEFKFYPAELPTWQDVMQRLCYAPEPLADPRAMISGPLGYAEIVAAPGSQIGRAVKAYNALVIEAAGTSMARAAGYWGEACELRDEIEATSTALDPDDLAPLMARAAALERLCERLAPDVLAEYAAGSEGVLYKLQAAGANVAALENRFLGGITRFIELANDDLKMPLTPRQRRERIEELGNQLDELAGALWRRAHAEHEKGKR